MYSKSAMKKNKSEFLSLLAIVLGVFLGLFLPDKAHYIEWMGTIFLSLLKVLILPIIMLSLFLAVARIASIEELKTLGLKTIGYYVLSTSVAVFTSLALAQVFIFQDRVASNPELTPTKTGIDFTERLFSTNIFNSLAEGEILHLVVFTLLFSIAFLFLDSSKKEPVLAVADSLYDVFLKLIEWVLKLAPLGILSLVWGSVSKFDMTTFTNIKSFFIATSIAAVLHGLVWLPLIGKFLGKFNVWTYFLNVKEALLVSLATASSAATLPVSTKLVEATGVSKKVSGFVLPLGATLNMDGSALYQALLALLFVALSGIDISMIDQVLLFLFIVLSSAGTAGIPSGGIVMMTMVIQMLHIPNPEYYLGLYVMVDRFWDYPITSINVWGDLIGAKTVDGLLQKESKTK